MLHLELTIKIFVRVNSSGISRHVLYEELEEIMTEWTNDFL